MICPPGSSSAVTGPRRERYVWSDDEAICIRTLPCRGCTLGVACRRLSVSSVIGFAGTAAATVPGDHSHETMTRTIAARMKRIPSAASPEAIAAGRARRSKPARNFSKGASAGRDSLFGLRAHRCFTSIRELGLVVLQAATQLSFTSRRVGAELLRFRGTGATQCAFARARLRCLRDRGSREQDRRHGDDETINSHASPLRFRLPGPNDQAGVNPSPNNAAGRMLPLR